MMGLHYLSIILYPLPESIDLLNSEGLNDPEALKEYIKTAPFGALICIMFAHISGAFLVESLVVLWLSLNGLFILLAFYLHLLAFIICTNCLIHCGLMLKSFFIYRQHF